MHHFADDTNLLHFNSSTKKLQRLPILNANKISLNVQKTELLIFKQKRKILDRKIKIKLNRKRFYPTPSVKYLRVKIGEKLNLHHHINDLAATLNRANAPYLKSEIM